MADLTLTALVTPNNQVTYVTLDGTPYRGDANNLTYARPEHVGYLVALGFTLATATQVPPGNALQKDVGWQVAV